MQCKTASQLVFCKHFCTSHCILPANSKKYNFVRSCLVLFAKYNSSHEQVHEKLVRTQFRITSYLSIALPKTLPHSKTIKIPRNFQYLVKTTLFVHLIFYKLIFPKTLTIVLEPTIKSVTGKFDSKKQQ